MSDQKNEKTGDLSLVAKAARDGFFAYKKATENDPSKPLTSLQERMQSGGAGVVMGKLTPGQ